MVGGFYLAFSAVVLPALDRRPAKEAVATMVAINQKAVRPPFMILFFGTAAACVAVAVTEPLTQSPIRAAGAAAYLAGWASTMMVNVPLNNRLATDGGARPDLEWNRFEQSWTRANLIRCGLSILGAVGLMIPVHHAGS